MWSVIFLVLALVCFVFYKTETLKSTRESCYTNMENRGIAVMGCCSGIMDSDWDSEQLLHRCIGCPFYVEIDGGPIIRRYSKGDLYYVKNRKL